MRRFLTFFGLVAVLWWSVVQIRARADSPWTGLGNGLETRVFWWHGVKVRGFRALPSHIKLASGDYLEVPDWLTRTGARVAINGGYFDGRGQPMGLRVSGGHKLSSLRRADWGVFWIAGNVAHIQHTRDFDPKTVVREAIQCGPRLVVAGKTTDLKEQWDPRSGLGIDKRGRVVLAVSDGQLTLDDWAQLFASNSGLDCRDALNLDGGGSTQLAFKTPKLSGKMRGSWPVPDAVTIR